MEKMRKFFPGLFALVLALLLALPAQANDYNCVLGFDLDGNRDVYFSCRLDRETGNILNPGVHNGNSSEFYSFEITDYGTFNKGDCTHYFTRTITLSMTVDGKTFERTVAVGNGPLDHNWDTEWSFDEEKGTHYHKCLRDGCDGRSDEDYHTVSSWTAVEGTDTHKGICSVCGEVTAKHNFTIPEGDRHVCSDCGAVQDHQWSDWCDDGEGKHFRMCNTCDLLSDPEYHSFVLTNIGEGYHQKKCVCGAVDGDPEKCQFELVDVGEGYHMSRCIVCDAIEEETEAELHQYGDWVPVAEKEMHKRTCACGAEETGKCSGGTATCAAPAVCATCGQSYGEKDPDNHDLVNHDAQAPTCTDIGWDAYDTCSRCDYTTYVEKKALGHDLVHHDAKAASCTEVGWDAYDTCSRCDYTTYKEIPALGHDLVKHDAKAATCTEAGWEAYDTCSRCDYSTYKEIPALGHDIEHHDAKPATCTEDGWPAYDTCKREGCNYTTLLMMQARLGHDLTHHEGKAATCTEAGWEAYDTCKREGCDYTTYKEIPALGHDLVKHDAKAATCTEAGWDAYDTCSRCSYTTYREIAAPGHIPGEPVVTAREEPQVGKAGSVETMTYCTVCGLELEYSYNQLPALPEPVPVPDTKEEATGKQNTEIAIGTKKSVLRLIPPKFREEGQELELSVIQQIISDDSGVYFQTEPDSVLPNIPPDALKLIEAKVWRLEKFSDLADRVSLDYTGSQGFPLNLDLIMILVYRDDTGEHWEVLKKPTNLGGSHLRVEVDPALVRKLQSWPFAIIVLADNGSR